MFSTVAMRRLSAVVLRRDQRAVLRLLGRLGAVHLVKAEPGPETAPDPPPDLSEQLARSDRLLAQVDRLLADLQLDATPPGDGIPDMTTEEVENKVTALDSRVRDALRRRADATRQWLQVSSTIDHAEDYAGLELRMGRPEGGAFLHFALGSLPVEDFAGLQQSVEPNVILLPLAEREGRRRVVAVTSRKGRFALETGLEQSGFVREPLPESHTGTLDEMLRDARLEAEHVDTARHRAEEEVAAIRQEAAPVLYDARAAGIAERRILEAEQNFPRTESTVVITGWIPADDVPTVLRRVREETAGRCALETHDPAEVPEEEIPVLLRHPRWLRPFEMLVTGYGLPTYRELEPTLFVAFSFLVMFGIMFGDVGHGGILAIAGLVIMLSSKAQQARDAGLLLIYGGTSSMAFGVVYGEYFGLHGWGLWHNPLEGDTIGMLMDAVLIGIVLISIGLLLNIVNRVRRGDVIGALFDKFGVFGALFYWGVLALLLRTVVYHQTHVRWPAVVLLIVVPLLMLAIKEPLVLLVDRLRGRIHHDVSFPMAAIESGIETFEAVLSYMANTISFVRLAAYAMSHAAILMATFLMARQASQMVGGGTLGRPVSILVIILGNLVAILLEALVAAVQAIRLEYYEFFSKFFSGAGRAFRPFRITESVADSSF